MDRNSLVGFTLIFILFYFWARHNAPSEAEMAAMQATQDSLAQVQAQADEMARNEAKMVETQFDNKNYAELDSSQMAALGGQFGVFAQSGAGTEKESVLENDKFKVTFTNKGGKIKSVLLKDHFRIELNDQREEIKKPLYLMDAEQNKFEYLLPVSGVAGGILSTERLFFEPQLNGNTVKFTARGANGALVEQTYTIQPDNYNIDYQVSVNGLTLPADGLQLNWINYLNKLERNVSYERNFSTGYFREMDENPDYCTCTSDDSEEIKNKVQWVSGVNQFFNSSLMANNSYFNSATVSTEMLPEEAPELKKISSQLSVPVQNGNTFSMKWYVGPNEFDRLAAYDNELEYVIPYGSSIFGTVNRWIIRPLFNFLSQFIGSKGLLILALTFIIKLVLYPLTYKMLYSQAKTQALKPKLESARAKAGDDPQKQQMETMKLYREYGVNPMGGCLPIFLQMPIWIALYRFFPASIEFRQASFLWATDLSSFDVFTYLPFNVPFYGDHVSMFTLLWAITTVIYTWYNSKSMDMGAMNNNPAFKYMQYLMPVMFLFFFNNFASGLSCYLFFSNIMNIGQNVLTKEVIIDKKKVKRELDEYQKKPKKAGGFQERLQKVLDEQRKIQEQEAAKRKKK